MINNCVPYYQEARPKFQLKRDTFDRPYLRRICHNLLETEYHLFVDKFLKCIIVLCLKDENYIPVKTAGWLLLLLVGK